MIVRRHAAKSFLRNLNKTIYDYSKIKCLLKQYFVFNTNIFIMRLKETVGRDKLLFL